jgi:hypothetical protein
MSSLCLNAQWQAIEEPAPKLAGDAEQQVRVFKEDLIAAWIS